MSPYRYTNICVYMDNYYSSPALFMHLKARGILACGTVHKNRKGLPSQLYQECMPRGYHMNKGECKVAQKDDLTFAVWQDTKPVLVLSNFHSPGDRGHVRRKANDGTHRDIVAPQMIVDYQENMRGVDVCDQLVGYYMLSHRSKKWWRRIFFYMLSVSVVNAYIIAKDQNEEATKSRWPNLQDFIEDIAEELIGDTPSPRAPPLVTPSNRPSAIHEIRKLYPNKRTCIECKLRRNGRPGVTKYGCVQCQKPVHNVGECAADHCCRHVLIQ